MNKRHSAVVFNFCSMQTDDLDRWLQETEPISVRQVSVPCIYLKKKVPVLFPLKYQEILKNYALGTVAISVKLTYSPE